MRCEQNASTTEGTKSASLRRAVPRFRDRLCRRLASPRSSSTASRACRPHRRLARMIVVRRVTLSPSADELLRRLAAQRGHAAGRLSARCSSSSRSASATTTANSPRPRARSSMAISDRARGKTLERLREKYRAAFPHERLILCVDRREASPRLACRRHRPSSAWYELLPPEQIAEIFDRERSS
jgi:hypothetical protein